MKREPTQAETIADLAARCERPDQFQNFDRAFRHSLTLSKDAVLKEEAKLKRLRARKRRSRTTERDNMYRVTRENGEVIITEAPSADEFRSNLTSEVQPEHGGVVYRAKDTDYITFNGVAHQVKDVPDHQLVAELHKKGKLR